MEEATNNIIDSGSATNQLFAHPDSNGASSYTEWDSLNFALEDSVTLRDCTTFYEPLFCYNVEPEAVEDGSALLHESFVAIEEEDQEEAMPLLALEDMAAQPTEHTDFVLHEAIDSGLLEGNLMLDWMFQKQGERAGEGEEGVVPLQPTFLKAAEINQNFELTEFVLHEAIPNGVSEGDLMPNWTFQDEDERGGEGEEVAVSPLVHGQLVSLQEPGTEPTFFRVAGVTQNVRFHECVLREAIDTEAEQRLLEGDLVPFWMLQGAMSDFVNIEKSFGTKPYSVHYRIIPADCNGAERVPNRLPEPPELTEDPVVMELVDDPAEESAFVDRMLARAAEGAAFQEVPESKPQLYKYYNLSVVGNITEPTLPKPSRKRPRKRMVLTKSPDRPKMTSKSC